MRKVEVSTIITKAQQDNKVSGALADQAYKLAHPMQTMNDFQRTLVMEPYQKRTEDEIRADFPLRTPEYEGYFHAWAAGPAAIVEKEDGTVEIVDAIQIRFLEPPEDA